jgi:hypothetical protein
MATQTDSTNVILSQFPVNLQGGEGLFSSDGLQACWGINQTFTYGQTMIEEQNTPTVYEVYVPNVAAFNASVQQQWNAPLWAAEPNGTASVQCSTAVYASLVAGGVPLGSYGYTGGTLMPSTFNSWMQSASKYGAYTGITQISPP